MTDQPIHVDEEIFLGRIEEQERFREALRSLLAGRKDDDWPFVFLLYGEGGMGKTKLARRLRDITVSEFKGRLRAVWLDWEERRKLAMSAGDYHLAAHDAVSPETVFEHIYAVFRDEGFGREFDPYEKAVKSRAEAETKVAQTLDAKVGEGGDRYSTLRELGGKGLAWLVRTGLPGGAAIPEEPTARLFESIIGGGAEGLARTREAATTLLRSKLNPDEFDLFTLPNETLGRRLADGIRAAARKKPLLLVLDTYEIADRADTWLRVVIKRAGPRVVWVIAGRDNLADSGKYGQTYFTGYRSHFPGHRLRVFPLTEFSLDDMADYFAWRVPGRPLDEDSVAAIHRATLGIPLAVKEAAAMWEEGASLADIVEGVPPRGPREQIVRAMSERFLLHCWHAPEDKARVYALALAHRPDPGLLAAMLDTETLERDLSDLRRRHSFVFVEEMQLHEAVAAFLHEYLVAPVRRASREVRRAQERAVKHLVAHQGACQAALPTLEERVADERWTTAVLGLVHHNFWLDEEDGWGVLLPAFVGGLAYNRTLARALLKTAEPLAGTFTEAGTRRLKVLQAGLSWLHDIFLDIETEAALLTELETAARPGWPDDGCNDERVAILALRQGRLLYRQGQYKEALELYLSLESALNALSKELRSQLGESMAMIGFRLFQAGAVEDAAVACRKSAIYLAEQVTELMKLGNACIYLGLYEAASVVYQTILAHEIDARSQGIVYANLGSAYRAQRRYEEAFSAHQRAIELGFERAIAHASLAAACRALGRETEFILHIQRARESMANESDYNKACIEAIAGNADEALTCLAQALEKRPGMRDSARRDPDFEELREDPRFWEVVGELSTDSGAD